MADEPVKYGVDPDKSHVTPEQRRQYGREWFEHITCFPAPAPITPYNRNGITDFVFGEMWCRPGLDVKARRWITLACVAASDTVIPIQSHIYSALKSGDISIEEMHEFTLHFAVYCGWPKASIVNQSVLDAWKRIEEEGGPTPTPPPEPIW